MKIHWKPTVFLVAALILFSSTVFTGNDGASAVAASARVSHRQAGLASAVKECSFTENLYTVRRELLRRCGYTLVPLQRVFVLRNGATAGATVYQYNEWGHHVTFLVPPRGFRPMEASAAALREYGIPSRSSLGNRSWRVLMRRIHVVVPPKYLIQGGPGPNLTCNGNTACWSGYVNTGNTYDAAEANWTEPKISSSTCSSTAEFMWVGLGGFGTDNLGQAGTSYGTGHPHGPWYEVIVNGANHGPTYATFGTTVGKSVSASVSFDGSQYQFSVVDDSTGKIYDPHFSTTTYDGSTADFVVEPPSGDNLANFGRIPVSGAKAEVGSVFKAVESRSNKKLTVSNPGTGHTLVTVSSFTEPPSDPSQWTLTQNHCD